MVVVVDFEVVDPGEAPSVRPLTALPLRTSPSGCTRVFPSARAWGSRGPLDAGFASPFRLGLSELRDPTHPGGHLRALPVLRVPCGRARRDSRGLSVRFVALSRRRSARWTPRGDGRGVARDPDRDRNLGGGPAARTPPAGEPSQARPLGRLTVKDRPRTFDRASAQPASLHGTPPVGLPRQLNDLSAWDETALSEGSGRSPAGTEDLRFTHRAQTEPQPASRSCTSWGIPEAPVAAIFRPISCIRC